MHHFQEVTARVFMPLFECPSNRCQINKAKGNLILQLRASKFLKFQEVSLLAYHHCIILYRPVYQFDQFASKETDEITI